MTKNALVPIANDIEEIEAVTIIDTLRRANTNVTVASVSGNLQVKASRNVNLVADKLIKDCDKLDFDLIVLPGGMPGAEHLRDCEILIDMIRKQKKSQKYYGAICASPAVVLSHHGLLDDTKATCYPSLMNKLKLPIDQKVIADNYCITSQGPGTALQFSLKLIEVLYDKETAAKLAREMLIDN